jgi:hypothetical protein
VQLQPGEYSIDLPAKHEAAFTDWRTKNAANVKITRVEPASDRSITQYTFKVINAPVEWLDGVAAPSKGGAKDVTPTGDQDYPSEEDPIDTLEKEAKKFLGLAEIGVVLFLGWLGWKAFKGELGGKK